MKSDYQEIFKKAYKLMNESVIDFNCGELCGYHCCRPTNPSGDKLGMYLLPLEYEYMQKNNAMDYEIHNGRLYDMPPKIKKLYYIYCEDETGCLRDHRPIQCRTYPFEPHLENGEFSLVIERDQIHACPLLDRIASWRLAYIEGIYMGWVELLKIPIIKYYVEFYSTERIGSQNITAQYSCDGWVTDKKIAQLFR